MKHQAVPSFVPQRRRKPEAVSSLLDSTFRALRIGNKVRQYGIFQQWPEIVGEALAKVTAPEKITRGRILVIKVLDAAWAQEATLQKDAILAKLRTLPNGPALENVRFVVCGPREFE